MFDTLELTQQLIRRKSVTPEDDGCQELIADRLRQAGFKCETLRFGDVTNLWARRGTASPVFCFAGHTDVVPTGPLEQWDSDPFTPDIRDGVLYGRGAADMKASLAGMIEATEQFVADHPRHPGTIAFLITSDEEGRARDGTKKVIETLDARGEKIDWCLIGEPSCDEQFGDTIRIGRRGSLSGMLTIHGQQGHVAYPHLANNPIQRFAPILADLYSQTFDGGNEYFPPTSFQVVQIESNSGAPNVTPDSLYTRFNFRYSTVWTHEQLQKHVEKQLGKHGLDYTLEWHLSGAPFLTPEGRLSQAIQEAVTETIGVKPEFSTGGGTSDGRFISPSGAHVVEFGPVNQSIHKANENIRVDDIEQLKSIYLKALEKLLSDDSSS
jgi:succinyl-diaminopimelate desuccinylase